MSNHTDFVWTEKFRPKTIDQCILTDSLKETFKGFVEKGAFPHLLLTGTAGVGKTSAAFALCKELGYDVMKINGSSEGRLIDTFRTKVEQFGSTVSFTGNRKVVIVDEADGMPRDTVQELLRVTMEDLSDNCTFILTCNYANQLIEPIHSRCTVIDFTIPNDQRSGLAKKMFVAACNILDTELITYEKPAVAEVVKRSFPDMRKVINDLQRYSVTGSIDSGILARANQDIDMIVQYLKAKNFAEMRKWVATAPGLQLVDLSRKLYERSSDLLVATSIPQFVLDTSTFQYQNAFVADKEIHIVAYLTTLMANCEFK